LLFRPIAVTLGVTRRRVRVFPLLSDARQDRMAHVLVTGGFGTIGRWVLREMQAQGHDVTVLELDTPRNRKLAREFAHVRLVWGDLRDAPLVASAVTGQDYVVHLGCILPPLADTNPDFAHTVNVGGTQNIIDACLAQPKPPRLIHGSSGEVYGATRHLVPPRTIDEARIAVNHYSAHKIEAEERVQASGLDYVIVRFSAVIDIALTNSHPLMFDFPVDVRMEVLHAADAALAVTNCLRTEAIWGRAAILPLAGGVRCQTTYGEFLTRMLETLGVGALPAEAFTPDDYPSDWHDTAESQALLQYQRHSLDDICGQVRDLLGWRRLFLPLARPFVRRSILSKSTHLRQRAA
jgi:nucleoside-diphosphate-sugar epimerase